MTIKQAFPAFLKATSNTRKAAQTLSQCINEAFDKGTLESELNPFLEKLNSDAKANGTPAQIEAHEVSNRVRSMVYDVTQGKHCISKVKNGKGFQVSTTKTRKPAKATYAKVVIDLKRVQADIDALPKAMKKELAELVIMLKASIAHVSSLGLTDAGVSLTETAKIDVLQDNTFGGLIDFDEAEAFEADRIDNDLLQQLSV